MRWYHAVIIAVGLAVAGALIGGGIAQQGTYDVKTSSGSYPIRLNRLTGQVDVFGGPAVGWVRLDRLPSVDPRQMAEEALGVSSAPARR